MSTTPDETAASAPDGGRRIAFVVGSGRSGTSTMSGTLQALGMHVPQPEVGADATNPKGFGEPQWIVEFHERLLNRVRVQTADARPQAWFDTERPAMREIFRNELFEWLEGQFEEAETSPANQAGTRAGTSELVIKDPRLVWFLGMWRGASIRCRATPTYITMLRPVTEVVGSKQKYYAGDPSRIGEISRTAGWVNVMLHTERATRDSERAFVRYADLLDDWTVPVFDLGERLHYAGVQRASAQDLRRVHSFIDPSLRRVQLTWDDVTVPARLREIAQESWVALDRLADRDGDTPEVRATLDSLREAYVDYYTEAELLTQSTAASARQEGVVAERDRLTALAEAHVSDTEAEGSRIPHSLRAMVPAGARRAVKQRLEARRGEQ
ncbi:MAG: sulfotransferase family protein [Nocardioides sp.]